MFRFRCLIYWELVISEKLVKYPVQSLWGLCLIYYSFHRNDPLTDSKRISYPSQAGVVATIFMLMDTELSDLHFNKTLDAL